MSVESITAVIAVVVAIAAVVVTLSQTLSARRQAVAAEVQNTSVDEERARAAWRQERLAAIEYLQAICEYVSAVVSDADDPGDGPAQSGTTAIAAEMALLKAHATITESALLKAVNDTEQQARQVYLVRRQVEASEQPRWRLTEAAVLFSVGNCGLRALLGYPAWTDPPLPVGRSDTADASQ